MHRLAGHILCRDLSSPARQLACPPSHAPSDDAAAPPHQGDATIVEGPAKFGGCLSQQHKALGVGDDLGSVEGLRGDTQAWGDPRAARIPEGRGGGTGQDGRSQTTGRWTWFCLPSGLGMFSRDSPTPAALQGTNSGYCQGQGPTFRMSSRNDFLSPLNCVFGGPCSFLLA